jgi:predicted Rossmann fold flavoprotein
LLFLLHSMNDKKTLIIIGAGAAGIFCAVNAARMQKDLNIIVVEKSNQILAKVRISGGGRCNFTHACDSITAMSKCYPRGEKFVKQSFKHFFTNDTTKWFGDRGVATKVEADGRMFPASDSSESIVQCLLNEAKKYAVEIVLQHGVQKIAKTKTGFELSFLNQSTMMCHYVMIACGGFPKLSQFEFIQNLGHTISEPIPSLFTFNVFKSPQTHLPKITDLMGVVAPNSTIKIMGTKLEASGATLITHWGLSGPTVLTLSAFAARYLHEQNYMYQAQINWCNHYNETSALEKIRTERNAIGNRNIGLKNPFDLPNRLWEYLLQCASIEVTEKWGTLSAKQQNALAKCICSYVFVGHGKTTYKDEFVTAGGVNIAEINAATCESKLIPNLFFAGEIIDVDGKTGGYNFQHAWTTGWIAANAIAQK